MNMTEKAFNVADVTEAASLGSKVAELCNKTGNTLGVTCKGIMVLSHNPENFQAFAGSLSASIQDDGRKILINAIKVACSRSLKSARDTYKDSQQRIKFASYSWKKNQPLEISWIEFTPEAADTAKPAKSAETAETPATAETAETPLNAQIQALETLLQQARAERDALKVENESLKSKLSEALENLKRWESADFLSPQKSINPKRKRAA